LLKKLATFLEHFLWEVKAILSAKQVKYDYYSPTNAAILDLETPKQQNKFQVEQRWTYSANFKSSGNFWYESYNLEAKINANSKSKVAALLQQLLWTAAHLPSTLLDTKKQNKQQQSEVPILAFA
jgi:hypothetical protein